MFSLCIKKSAVLAQVIKWKNTYLREREREEQFPGQILQLLSRQGEGIKHNIPESRPFLVKEERESRKNVLN